MTQFKRPNIKPPSFKRRVYFFGFFTQYLCSPDTHVRVFVGARRVGLNFPYKLCPQEIGEMLMQLTKSPQLMVNLSSNFLTVQVPESRIHISIYILYPKSTPNERPSVLRVLVSSPLNSESL